MNRRLPAPIRIENALGVVHPYGDTHLLAELGAEADGPPGRALDLGTGTGYVAIFLAQRGWTVDAVDISERALALARRNAERNGVSVSVFRSNWFDAVEGSYDVIACNPPMSSTETDRTRLLTATLRRVPSVAWRLHQVTQPWLERRRFGFLRTLVAGARRHLRQGGRLFLVVSPREERELLRAEPALERVMSETPRSSPPNLVVAGFRFRWSLAMVWSELVQFSQELLEAIGLEADLLADVALCFGSCAP